MSTRPRIPLILKLLGWLFLHLTLLALAFFGFVSWQLGLGLDSLLSGAAGERLTAFAVDCRKEMLATTPPSWNQALASLAAAKSLKATVFDPSPTAPSHRSLPTNVRERAAKAIPRRANPGPPNRPDPGRPGHPGPDAVFPPPRRSEDPPRQPLRAINPTSLPPPRPAFLVRGHRGDGYWAGIQVPMPGGPRGEPPRHELLLLRSETIGGNGLFFDLKPWLWGGLAVLALSLAVWAPFVLAITRYVRRLTQATGEIAAGNFKVVLPLRRSDELGLLGTAIQTMARRLDHLVTGQKRFLGDAAHELCAPLARLRTGLGILEHQIHPGQHPRLDRIEGDAAELANLIAELLEFSRTGNSPAHCQPIELLPWVADFIARNDAPGTLSLQIPPDTRLLADPRLLARALGNLIRNAGTHAGPSPHITLHTTRSAGKIILTVADDGPGVPAEDLPRLFEPFYRPDRSRSRETGGHGLGLAIVRAAVEACGGTVTAEIPPTGGFAVHLALPADPSPDR
jgi:two-component system sensor histidine kinase CpxA